MKNWKCICMHGSILIVHVSLDCLNFYRHTTVLNGYHGGVLIVNDASVSIRRAHTTTMLANKYSNILNYSVFSDWAVLWFPEDLLADLTILLIPVFTCKFFAFCPISHNANPHKKWRLMLQHQHAWQMGSSFNVQTTYLKCLKGIWGYNYWCHFTLKYSTHNYSSF